MFKLFILLNIFLLKSNTKSVRLYCQKKFTIFCVLVKEG